MHFCLASAVFLLSSLFGFHSGAWAQEETRPFTAADVFDLEWADAPEISPDGKQALYIRRSNDVMVDRTRSHVWLVSLDGTV
ncbi:MAG: S9 family peptidase, partial [Pseudomonadota bacterium]